jgi:hypothetical protein
VAVVLGNVLFPKTREIRKRRKQKKDKQTITKEHKNLRGSSLRATSTELQQISL